jgi:predicted RNA-binding Zn-ribbon protein involved in translation (DUF1610 family)
MTEITPETFPTLQKVNPLDGLPEYLKDPKNYMKVQKALLDTMRCPKAHGEVTDVFKCPKCTENMLVRKELMRKFGFKSPNQYMAWKKTHEDIKRSVPLDKYNYMLNHE